MTYEQAINHYVKFPGHSLVLHKIFNPLVSTPAIVVVMVAGAYLLNLDMYLGVFIAILAGGLFPLKLSGMFNTLIGHGVGIYERGRFRILGIPEKMFYIIIPVPTALIIVMIWTTGYLESSTLTESTILNYQFLVGSLALGFLVSLLSWRFHTYYETWYGSEYDARVSFTKSSSSENEVLKKLEVLYRNGILYRHVE